jgi:HlyD family secretion protein
MVLSPPIRKYGIWGAGALAALVLGFFLFRAPAVSVDMAEAIRGPLSVTVDERGRTRVRDIYVVYAPVTGYLRRIQFRAGDTVDSTTVLAAIEPADPSFLDIRSRAQAETAIDASEQALNAARAESESAETQLEFAASELERIERLAEMGAESQAQLDRARLEHRVAQSALAAAQSAVRMRTSELQTVRALLVSPQTALEREAAETQDVLPLWAPATGRVLRLIRQSEGIVMAGEPILEIGNPANLEIVAELLSADALKVADGAAVEIHTGNEGEILEGQVLRVEPYGFTKISALGVEEQRVNVIITLTSPREEWERLTHGFRVEVRIAVWQEDDVLQVPIGALFRIGEEWAVFRNDNGRAATTIVDVGALNTEHAEILGGLAEGDQVILYPSDTVGDGTRLAERNI